MCRQQWAFGDLRGREQRGHGRPRQPPARPLRCRREVRQDSPSCRVRRACSRCIRRRSRPRPRKDQARLPRAIETAASRGTGAGSPTIRSASDEAIRSEKARSSHRLAGRRHRALPRSGCRLPGSPRARRAARPRPGRRCWLRTRECVAKRWSSRRPDRAPRGAADSTRRR